MEVGREVWRDGGMGGGSEEVGGGKYLFKK